LEIVKEIAMSPHLGLDNLFKAFVANSTVDIQDHLIKRALIKGRFNIYPCLDNKFVRNISSRSQEEECNPLLGVRVLATRKEFRDQTPDNPFSTITQLTDYIQAMGIEFKHTLGWIDYFLKSCLCRSYDPTLMTANQAQRIELTPSGERHYIWATNDEIYLRAMMEITPILERESFESIETAFLDEGEMKKTPG